MPPPPISSQILNSSLVTLLSGVLATTIFLAARTQAKDSMEPAGIDAIQATEMGFALAGGIIFLDSPLPNMPTIVSLLPIAAGIIMLVWCPKRTVA